MQGLFSKRQVTDQTDLMRKKELELEGEGEIYREQRVPT